MNITEAKLAAVSTVLLELLKEIEEDAAAIFRGEPPKHPDDYAKRFPQRFLDAVTQVELDFEYGK